MTEQMRIIQKTGISSDTTNIAVQNNYGISAERASQMAINLFLENFPKLQEQAMNVAKERAEELCGEVINKLQTIEKHDYCEFAEPDLQYVFYEAQKGYARYGDKELLQLLSGLICERVVEGKDWYVKRVIDEAIKITVSLSEKQIDYLTFIFLTKHVHSANVKDIETLKLFCEDTCRIIKVDPVVINHCSYLNMLGCFELVLGEASEVFSKLYNIPKEEIQKILPEQYDTIPGDYGLSPSAKLIAIMNANEKFGYNLDLKKWIHE